MKTAREIAARIWCDPEMSGIAMDTVAAEHIATIIQSVLDRREIPGSALNDGAPEHLTPEQIIAGLEREREHHENAPALHLRVFGAPAPQAIRELCARTATLFKEAIECIRKSNR